MKDFNDKRGSAEVKVKADFDDIELQKRNASERQGQPQKTFKYGAEHSEFEMESQLADENQRPRGFTKIENILANFDLQDHDLKDASSVA